MNGRVRSKQGNRYAQIFFKKKYFYKIYPMDSKGQAGEALKTFRREFGIPEHPKFDGLQEQSLITFLKSGITIKILCVLHYA